MGIEIERKFLLANDTWKDSTNEGMSIKQGYLNGHAERTVRVRIKGKKAYLTIKSKVVKISRQEFEYEIPLEEAKQLLLLCEKPLIEKTRFEVNLDDTVWEIDVFDGENKGLVIAEVELKSENQAIKIPDWIGEEVSNEAKYYNSNLIKFPFKEW